jgi:hypothetical protein
MFLLTLAWLFDLDLDLDPETLRELAERLAGIG